MILPNYSTRDPKGWCGDPRRGAALGRFTIHAKDRTAPVKLYLRCVRLDSGGYDVNGTYFGTGTPLYWCADESSQIDYMVRANDRNDAKSYILDDYPNARFFR